MLRPARRLQGSVVGEAAAPCALQGAPVVRLGASGCGIHLPCPAMACPAVTTRDAKLAAVDRPPRERSDVLVRKPEDVAFVAALVEQVTEWLQARARCRMLHSQGSQACKRLHAGCLGLHPPLHLQQALVNTIAAHLTTPPTLTVG